MAEIRYLISDAAKKVDVESHVLRYWEDELEMQIPRNEMGHRYYTDYQIRLFRQIKELKERGYQLKAIKSALNKMSGEEEDITITEDYMEEDMKAAWKESQMREGHTRERQTKEKGKEEENVNKPETEETSIEAAVTMQPMQTADMTSEKMVQLQSIMNHIIGQAMEANMERISKEITKEVSENVSENVSESISENVTDRVMKEVEYLMRVNDEKEEERFKQLDETIRAYQKNGKGRAEAAATKMPFFKKKKFGKSGKKLF